MQFGIKSILIVAAVVATASIASLQVTPWTSSRVLGKPYTISSSKEHSRTKGVLVTNAIVVSLKKPDDVELVEAWVESNSTTNN